MGELISQEELDRAFDARFPKEMQVKLRSAKVAIAGLGGQNCAMPEWLWQDLEDWDPILQ